MADMEQFVEDQLKTEQAVREKLEQQNAARKREYERWRAAGTSFKVGDKCCVRCPKGGDKHKTWLGPCKVRKVEGRESYLVQVSEIH